MPSVGRGLTLCLRQIESRYRLESGHVDLDRLFYRLPVLVEDGLPLLIQFVLLPVDLEECRRENTNSFLSPLHKAPHLLPSGVGLAERCIRLLQHNEEIVVIGVLGEFCHGVEEDLVLLTAENIRDALLQLLRELLHLILAILRGLLRIVFSLCLVSSFSFR